MPQGFAYIFNSQPYLQPTPGPKIARTADSGSKSPQTLSYQPHLGHPPFQIRENRLPRRCHCRSRFPPSTLATSRSASTHHLERRSCTSCRDPVPNAASSKLPLWAWPDSSPVFSPPVTLSPLLPPAPNPQSPLTPNQTHSRPVSKRHRSRPCGIPLRPAASNWEPSIPSPKPHSCLAAGDTREI